MPSLFRPTLLLLVVVVLFAALPGSDAQRQLLRNLNERKLEGDHPLVGGFSPIPVSDPMAVQAGDYALEAFLNAPPERYAFVGTSLTASASTKNTSLKILEASQQVVAGLNIQLTVMLKNKGVATSSDDEEDPCLGAFVVTIYNHFGEFSINQWGEEMSCQDAYAIKAPSVDSSEDAI